MNVGSEGTPRKGRSGRSVRKRADVCVMLKVTGVHIWKRVFYFFPIGLTVLHQVYPSFPQNSF